MTEYPVPVFTVHHQAYFRQGRSPAACLAFALFVLCFKVPPKSGGLVVIPLDFELLDLDFWWPGIRACHAFAPHAGCEPINMTLSVDHQDNGE